MASLPKNIIIALERLYEMLDMSDPEQCAVAEAHKQAMKIYLDSWIRPVLQEMTEYLRGIRDLRGCRCINGLVTRHWSTGDSSGATGALLAPAESRAVTKGVRVLIYEGKHGDQHFLAHDHDELDRAFLKMFQLMDSQSFYDGDDDELIVLARNGDAKAARAICNMRSDYEYEGFRIEEAIEP